MSRVQRGGRKGMTAALADELEAGGAEALKKLRELVRSPDAKVALDAAKVLADRAYGKPKQEEGTAAGPVLTVVLSGWDKPELVGKPAAESDEEAQAKQQVAERVAKEVAKALGEGPQ